MAEMQIPSGIVPLLREILEGWRNRNERDAAKEAGKLTFWRDGMLRQLELIAEGRGTNASFGELYVNLSESGDDVQRSMKQLAEARDKIGPTEIGRQIDLILNHDVVGKSSIREAIKDLFRTYLALGPATNPSAARSELVQCDAQEICNQVKALNSEIQKLYRMVYS